MSWFLNTSTYSGINCQKANNSMHKTQCMCNPFLTTFILNWTFYFFLLIYRIAQKPKDQVLHLKKDLFAWFDRADSTSHYKTEYRRISQLCRVVCGESSLVSPSPCFQPGHELFCRLVLQVGADITGVRAVCVASCGDSGGERMFS